MEELTKLQTLVHEQLQKFNAVAKDLRRAGSGAGVKDRVEKSGKVVLSLERLLPTDHEGGGYDIFERERSPETKGIDSDEEWSARVRYGTGRTVARRRSRRGMRRGTRSRRGTCGTGLTRRSRSGIDLKSKSEQNCAGEVMKARLDEEDRADEVAKRDAEEDDIKGWQTKGTGRIGSTRSRRGTRRRAT